MRNIYHYSYITLFFHCFWGSGFPLSKTAEVHALLRCTSAHVAKTQISSCQPKQQKAKRSWCRTPKEKLHTNEKRNMSSPTEILKLLYKVVFCERTCRDSGRGCFIHMVFFFCVKDHKINPCFFRFCQGSFTTEEAVLSAAWLHDGSGGFNRADGSDDTPTSRSWGKSFDPTIGSDHGCLAEWRIWWICGFGIPSGKLT